VETAVVGGVIRMGSAVAQLVPLSVCMILLSPRLAALAIGSLAFFAVATSIARRRSRRHSDESQSLAEQLHCEVDELIGGVELWQSYGSGEAVRTRVEQAAEAAARSNARASATRAALSGGNEVLAAFALLGAVALSNHLGVSIADGSLLAFSAVFFMAYRPLRDLGDARVASTRGAVALEALERIAPLSLADAAARQERAPKEPATSTWRPSPTRRRWGPPALLRLTDFGAARGGPQASWTVLPGEIVCLKGPTGSGKTTLLRAMLGLEPAVGELGYGGVDLAPAEHGPECRPFAWVPQDAPLISGTVLDNVCLIGCEATAARDALTSIGAGALADRAAASRVGPSGRSLSGGERRQIALARALATELPVLLLDEPTEGLDPLATARVLEALQSLRGRRSVVVVSHRAEVAAVADRVVELGEAAGLERSAAE
jgi:ABC-type multidrug transport system fused ATPase/permease subunit